MGKSQKKLLQSETIMCMCLHTHGADNECNLTMWNFSCLLYVMQLFNNNCKCQKFWKVATDRCEYLPFFDKFLHFFVFFWWVSKHGFPSHYDLETKSNWIEIFMSYGELEVIGHITWEWEERAYTNRLWCKVCGQNKARILKHPSLHGSMHIFFLMLVLLVQFLKERGSVTLKQKKSN